MAKFWNRFLKAQKPRKAELPTRPFMTDEEIALLTKYIPAGGSVLEFGCGGSSKYFFEQGVSKLVSVESDPAWLAVLTANPEMKARQEKGQWLPIYIDLGKVGKYGRPMGESKNSWLNYHATCWPMLGTEPLDLILIDGRFRVACFLQTILQYTRHDFLILIHDFFNRPEYHIILAFADVVDRAGRSVVLKVKAHFDVTFARELLLGYQYSPE